MISHSSLASASIGDSAECAAAHERMVDDEAYYRRAWLVAHGYLPDPCPPPPRDDIHLCGSRGYYITGSRAACPDCKIAAPLDAGPGIE